MDSLEKNSIEYKKIRSSFMDSLNKWVDTLDLYSFLKKDCDTFYLNRIVLFNSDTTKAIINFTSYKNEYYNKLFGAIKIKEKWSFYPSVNEFYRAQDPTVNISYQRLDTLIINSFIYAYEYMDYKKEDYEVLDTFFNGGGPIRFFENYEKSLKSHYKDVSRAILKNKKEIK